ncbi:MAG: hypothetical protein RBT05_07700, partial [Bacteroidales bacterium]|nr:hypothetical protein [Bacteroidales bacterium]
TSEFWLAKSIVLLGDVYYNKGKNMLAKQTYQSIVDNYEGDLVEVCREKIENILKEEKAEKEKQEQKIEEKKDEVDEVIIGNSTVDNTSSSEIKTQ